MLPTWILAATLALASPQPPASPPPTQQPAAQEPSTQSGRVVGTITVLEGTVRMPGVNVELHAFGETMAIAKTTTDGAGQVTFPDVPTGRYVIVVVRPGLASDESAPFDVRGGDTKQVLLDIPLTFQMPAVEVRAPSVSPTESVQPVSRSDRIPGSVLDVAPLEGDDFQSLLPLLPGVVRGPDGRLRLKGGNPTQSALQMSSASLIDPSSGDFDLDLPGQSLESVEVLSNPFAAEYGRFSSSVTQIRTRRGTNTWEFKPGNFVPRIRKSFNGIRAFEPRFSLRGPLKHDRLFFAQDFQFRYVNTPVKSLPGEPEIRLLSFDSFTRVDSVISSRHTLGAGLVMFPREFERPTMNTFRPPETTPEFNQSGFTTGLADRFSIAPDAVLETTISLRKFEINVNTDAQGSMIYAPESQSGAFFNDQEREVDSIQWVEALSISRDHWKGQHVFKFGFDVQRSAYDGTSMSRPLDVRRLDGSPAELTIFSPPNFFSSRGTDLASTQDVESLEVAGFVQDRWRMGSRVTFELGLRLDRDGIVEKVNWSPRAGVSIGVLPEGRGILRGGFGKFVQRTPLNIGAFDSFETRDVMRFTPNGFPIGPVSRLRNVTDDLKSPEAYVATAEWGQRFGRRLLFKGAYLNRHGSHEFILNPEPNAADPLNGIVRLSSTGRSRYWEMETTARYLGGERRDLTISYVRSHGIADLNDYDQFYGNFRNPILRANERSLIATDVPNRLLIRGTIGLPGKWDLAPVAEIRSGFPYSAVNEFQDFVGARNRAGRLPQVHTLDIAVSRPWRLKGHRFRAGLKVYNLFGASAERDVQNNLTSPEFGQFFNPIERSIGIVLGSAK